MHTGKTERSSVFQDLCLLDRFQERMISMRGVKDVPDYSKIIFDI